MTSDPKHSLDPEDRAVRARHGFLAPEERGAFERTLEGSATLRTSYETGLAFDRIGAVREGDEALIARSVDRALGRLRTRASSSTRTLRRGALIGIAATLIVASAAAWWRGGYPRWLFERSRETGARTAPVGATRPAAPQVRAPVRSPAPALESPEPAPAMTSTASTRLTPTAPTHARTSNSDSAQSLFRSANGARATGEFERAVLLYQRLEREHPGSDEARLAHVSLGKLLLGRGRTAEAERQFADYAASGGGALVEEAMMGRAECLARLGRRDEERVVLERLLLGFPGSVYRQRAGERLRELDSHAP